MQAITERSEVRKYLDAISEGFCPFSRPSEQDRQLQFTEYQTSPTPDLCFAQILVIGIMHTERLRIERKERKNGFLWCENTIFETASDTIKWRKQLSWLHWVLKVVYFRHKVIFGKFWQGQEVKSLGNGKPVPIPPMSYLSIRSLLNPNDRRFLESLPEFRQDFTKGVDTETSFVEQWLADSRLPSVKAWKFPLSPHAISLLVTSGLPAAFLAVAKEAEKRYDKQQLDVLPYTV